MIHLLAGDCRDVLPTLAADSVQCVVCSPPYYGLRDYGTALWDGGDAACDHIGGLDKPRSSRPLGAFHGGDDQFHTTPFRDTCGKCGAVRIDRQIGLEALPSEYLATMVAVFREVRRVLRPDGTCWVNMGDSYSSGSRTTQCDPSGYTGTATLADGGARRAPAGIAKPKDLLLMPARLALALQADGWWVRSDIIWHKPNPMPESCTDRPTSAHEHVFLLTKSARYFYDADAVREPHADWRDGHNTAAPQDQSGVRKWNPGRNEYNPAGRSCRNVWTIATSPFSAAHFATFPPELAERCIRAGTSERGACSQCGKPWGRIVERDHLGATLGRRPEPMAKCPSGKAYGSNTRGMPFVDVTTTGWSPGCKCDADVKPCVVLDPFFGAGTTGLVAERLQRDCIGIDLNPDYNVMSRARIEADAPLFTSFPPAEPPEDARMADPFADLAAD